MPKRPDTRALRQWLAQTRNDLEMPARTVAPSIGDAIAALGEAGASFARMSGSGATCFGLYEDAAQARRAARAIHNTHPQWFVVATESGASEESPDAGN